MPVVSHISGGLDSTVVLGLQLPATGIGPPSFTIGLEKCRPGRTAAVDRSGPGARLQAHHRDDGQGAKSPRPSRVDRRCRRTDPRHLVRGLDAPRAAVHGQGRQGGPGEGARRGPWPATSGSSPRRCARAIVGEDRCPLPRMFRQVHAGGRSAAGRFIDPMSSPLAGSGRSGHV